MQKLIQLCGYRFVFLVELYVQKLEWLVVKSQNVSPRTTLQKTNSDHIDNRCIFVSIESMVWFHYQFDELDR